MERARSFLLKHALFAGACGAVTAAGFGWPGGWVIVQAGLAAFLWLMAMETSAKRAAWQFFAFVLSFYGFGESGFSLALSADLRPWAIGLLIGLAVAQAGVAWVTTYLAFRLPVSMAARLLLVVPALWMVRELAGSRLDASVPWLALGYAHAPDGPLAALLPIGGVYLVSGCAVALSAALALAFRRALPMPALKPALCLLAGAAALFTAGRAEWTSPGAEAAIELWQTGSLASEDAKGDTLRRHLGQLATLTGASNAALIVTPQLSIPKVSSALPAGYLALLESRLKDRHADALIGLYVDSGLPDVFYNAAQALGTSGDQRYLKQHLFPYGEYLPLPARAKQWIDSRLANPRANGAPGPASAEPILAGGMRLAVSICYDLAFGDSVRRSAATAEAVVNMGADGSHDSPQIARQTRQMAQARALELQKPLVRTSDVRGTYFIDARGGVSEELEAGRPASAVHRVAGRTGLTPFARWGDVLAATVAAALLLMAPRQRAERQATSGRPHPGPGRVRVAGIARRHRGQVLPVALAFLVIVAGFFYFMVNAGQTVTEKIRVTNAADAAAYSAAVVEARALNYDAYLNRAMVANQMAIAQMVSFASWIDYFAKAADNFGTYVTDINYFMLPNLQATALEVAFGGSAVVAAYFGGSTVQEYADYVIDYGAGAIITVHDAATQALSLGQKAVQLNLFGGIRQGQVAEQVVKAMDANLHAEVVLTTHQFDSFSKNYSGDERARFADVAMRSRDPFTKERNFTLSAFDIPLVRKDSSLKKRGGTELIGLDEWRGVDTLELHGKRFFCGKVGLSWCDDVKTPIGWGGIEVDAGGGDAGHGYHGNAYGENPTTARRSDSAMRSPSYGYFSGIPSSQEIKDSSVGSNPTTAITILVSKSQSDTLTSGNAASVGPSGRLAQFDDHPAGGKMIALGRAEVYFDRIAARADGKDELGSLYNPYWRVRMVAATNEDRVYASTKQGGLLIPDPSRP